MKNISVTFTKRGGGFELYDYAMRRGGINYIRALIAADKERHDTGRHADESYLEDGSHELRADDDTTLTFDTSDEMVSKVVINRAVDGTVYLKDTGYTVDCPIYVGALVYNVTHGIWEVRL